jgi:hypothetical protein
MSTRTAPVPSALEQTSVGGLHDGTRTSSSKHAAAVRQMQPVSSRAQHTSSGVAGVHSATTVVPVIP